MICTFSFGLKCGGVLAPFVFDLLELYLGHWECRYFLFYLTFVLYVFIMYGGMSVGLGMFGAVSFVNTAA